MKDTIRFLVILHLASLFLIPSVLSIRVISNSEDWRDVFSVVQYANFRGDTASFLVSQRHSTILLYELDPGSTIQVFSSSQYPFITGYESLLLARGYDAEEIIADNVNLELARRLPDINKYIVIDDAYGYNAVSVAPYGQVSKSYVLFADRNNIGDIADFLAERNPESIIIYGHVHREVKDALTIFNPEIINFDGDRFDNNIEIVKMYRKIKPSNQVILTNGEFLESEILSGAEPVLFIGAANVPEQVRDYIAESDIEVGVLIGNQYVGSATTIKRQAGISVFVKFARSARVPESAISPVEGLDLFYLPSYQLSLEIVSIVYNQLTNQLEVTYRNNVDLATYFLGTYALNWGDGQRQTVGDLEPVFIDGLEYKTVVYDVGQMFGDIIGDVHVIYGDSKRSLEYVIDATFQVEVAQITDNAKIKIIGVEYDKVRNEFLVEIKNIGEVDAFVDVELIDVIIAGERFTFSSDKIVKLKPGESKKLRVKVDLEEIDFEDNEEVFVRAHYGEREQNLVRVEEGRFKVTYLGLGAAVSAYGVPVIIVIVVLILLFLIFRRKKKCPECKEKNERRRKYCKKCGAKLK